MKKILMAVGIVITLGATNASGQKNGQAMANNPFFAEYDTPFGVPPFDKIKLEHYKPAFLQGMEEQMREIDAITSSAEPAGFENTVVALDRSGKLLRSVSAVFYGLNSADTSDDMQALSKELSPLLSKHNDDIYLNQALFARVKAVYDALGSSTLDKEQKKLVEKTYKQFVRQGAHLDAGKQASLRELNSRIALLQLTFGQNMLKETNAFRLVVTDENDLSGLPANLVASAAETAKAAGQEGKWIFTLHNPSIMPFLQFSDKRELRKQIFEAYLNRGNNGNDADNKEIVKQLVALRLEKARLMGYDDYASFVLDDRMAADGQQVYDLLGRVWKPALAKAKEEAAELQALMQADGVTGELEGWDWRYYNEKNMQAKFDLDETQIRPYLRLENVRKGMFHVANRLYGVTFTELQDIPKPHADAVAFECKDASGEHLGVLYMDYFPRESKRGGAWCGTYRTQTYENGAKVAPVVTIVCNFSKPSGNQPALLSVDEASTMFHEFGHALHNLFKDVHYYGVSGVPRDFVELPSQVMEHWVLEPEVLAVYAHHYQTGEPIPAGLLEKLKKSGKYGQGFITAEYVQASLLDMDYHTLKEVPADFDVVRFETDAMKRIGALGQIPPRYRSTYFNHTMGGGYTAGYYSYMWAEVLDADAFEAYVERGDIFDQATAGKFRKYILTPGCIDEAADMYKNFRGAEPGIEPLLRNRGLLAE